MTHIEPRGLITVSVRLRKICAAVNRALEVRDKLTYNYSDRMGRCILECFTVLYNEPKHFIRRAIFAEVSREENPWKNKHTHTHPPVLGNQQGKEKLRKRERNKLRMIYHNNGRAKQATASQTKFNKSYRNRQILCSVYAVS